MFLPCTRAQGLKVRALSEKADPGAGCSPQRGAEGWGWRSLQVAPLPLLQAPLYVPLLGARHGGALQHSLHVPYLDDMVLTNSGQQLPPCVIAHVLHYVPGVKEVCSWSLLMVSDRDIAALADPHRILVASVSECAPLAAAVITDGLPTLATVVLAQSNLFLVVHRLQVPEERLVAQLTVVTFSPIGSLKPGHLHVPADKPRVLPGAE